MCIYHPTEQQRRNIVLPGFRVHRRAKIFSTPSATVNDNSEATQDLDVTVDLINSLASQYNP